MKTINYYLIVVVAILSFYSCNSNNTEAVLQGKLRKESLSIAPKIPGRIVEIRTNEAAQVKKGDTLAVLNIPEVEAKIEQAEGAVFSAKSQYEMALHGATKEQVEQINARYKVAEEQYNFAKKSMERVKNMFKDSLISAQKYDETFAKFNAAKAQLEGVKAKQNEVLGGVRGEKIRMAEGQLRLAEGKLKEANIAYNERFIIAPRNMSIETIALKEGELALAGYNLFVGYIDDTSFFRFTVKESAIINFQINKEYTIELPFEKKSLTAKLVAVKQLAHYANKTSAYPDYELGEAVYELKLIPQNKQDVESLYNNYTAILKYN